MAAKKTYKCAHSGKEVEGNPSRLPRGWKRNGNEFYSPEAWHTKYVARAVTVPIVCPVVPDGTGPQSTAWKEAWEQFRRAVADAWKRSTNATAWAYRELLQRDTLRMGGVEKMPKLELPQGGLYKIGNTTLNKPWEGWSQSASSVLRLAEAKYRSKRYEIVWQGRSRLPDARYPQPYPVPSQGFTLSIDGNGRPQVDFRLPAGRVAVWLKGGANYRRQRGQIQWLIDHPELIGEAAIYERGNDVMVKVVGWFPRKDGKANDGTLHVRTDSESIIVALNDADERLFVIHGDRAKDWTTRHNHWLQRQRDDQKMKRRIPRRKSRKEREDVTVRCKKFNDRIGTFVDQTAAQIVNYAARRKLAVVKYDDRIRDYLDQFPWYRLELGIKTRCEAVGITFEKRSADEKAGTSRKTPK